MKQDAQSAVEKAVRNLCKAGGETNYDSMRKPEGKDKVGGDQAKKMTGTDMESPAESRYNSQDKYGNRTWTIISMP